ncbi:PucR family transcriptional regulator [Nocardia sp. CA-107356]|uniref:PucR family transcriptional regulator n=1 Tax=Nocardia sp. CA-107356 TaxID=3239972 RepID=UPI003D943295
MDHALGSPSAGDSLGRQQEGRDELLILASYYLERLDDQVDSLVARLRERMPEYAAVPTAELRAYTAAIIRSALEQLPVTDGGLDAGGIRALQELARRRVEQGFPLEALTRSIQISARFVLDALDEEASKRGLSDRVVLAAHDLAWRFANDAAGVINAVRHEVAVEAARRDAEQRVDFLRALLHAQLSAARISVDARTFGLDPTAKYQPLCARPADQNDWAALTAVLQRTCATHELLPVVAVVDGDLVAVVPKCPVVGDRWLVATAEPAGLTDLAYAFDEAVSTLEIAQTFGLTGLVTIADLGPLPLAMLGADTAAHLEHRYLRALDDGQPGRQDVEDTVWDFLEYDRNLDQTALDLHVHRNTVRYRLARFQELTNLDLRCTRDVVLAWCLLAHRRVQRS